MAGGKETPRQKMVGMMYLVLTALLALNVSKAILDAFVAIEENIQVTNQNEYNRGQSKIADLMLVANDGSEPELQKKAQKLLTYVNQIDKITLERIKLIDDLKLEILERCGEDVKSVGSKSIIDSKKNSNDIEPLKLNLEYVNGQDKYDEPMALLIGEDIKKPGGEGLRLWNSYNDYRENLTDLVVKSAPQAENGKAYFFKSPMVKNYKDAKDLENQIDNAIKKSNIDLQEIEDVKKIYTSLSKNEYSTVHEIGGVHWIGKTFDHAPVVAALASLTAMQKEILTARADAINLIRNRVTGGQYSFNKIMAMAYGPEVVNQNEEVDLNVLMVAYDSDRQPVVTMAGNKINDVADGKAHIKVKANGSEMNLAGEITITNKSGQTKTLPWNKKIRVMKPAGTAALVEMNMMYRGYRNLLEAVASGFEKTSINVANGTYTKEGNLFVIKPGTSKTCTVTVLGKNEGTGKTVALGTYSYRVSNLPSPSLKYGNNENGATISRGSVPTLNKVFAAYPPSIPLNAEFTVISWSVGVQGINREEDGKSNTLTAEAISLIKQCPPNGKVTITAKVLDPAGGRRYITSIFTIK